MVSSLCQVSPVCQIVTFDGRISLPSYCGQFFNGSSFWENVQDIDFQPGIDTSNVTDMHLMFAGGTGGCKRLARIKGLGRFDTRRVTTMQSMFENTT
ncbi:MAG: DUF285 domain-containing protein [Clostridia bacterium]|nr:DUF285 domain-containing protein [Clostridia bacterium]